MDNKKTYNAYTYANKHWFEKIIMKKIIKKNGKCKVNFKWVWLMLGYPQETLNSSLATKANRY